MALPPDDMVSQARLDRTALSIGNLDDDNTRAYWAARTPEERLAALELLRQIIYGYDPATTRLQRVLEIAEL